MASKKSPAKPSRPQPARTPGPSGKSQLQNLAARPVSFDDTVDEQLVDNSGVFRVTAAISQAQTGHDEESGMRFPNDSLVMAAQREGFPDDGPTIDESTEEHTVDDEVHSAAKRQRLATLAARAAAINPRRR